MFIVDFFHANISCFSCSIPRFRIRKNRGVGYARQLGTRISKYNYIFYLDSDVVLESENSIKILFEEFKNLKNTGSIGPVQNYKNLNDEFTSDFVAAKTCYGFEDVENEVEFSGMRSECCFMKKDFLCNFHIHCYYFLRNISLLFFL